MRSSATTAARSRTAGGRAHRHQQPAAPRVSRARRPDFEHVELRGNVPTRVERLRRGEYDAIMLAAAGLARLGLDSAHLAATAAGGLPAGGVAGRHRRVCARRRCGDPALAAPLDDREARLAATAERALLRRIEGGCQVPLGALATVTDRLLRLEATVCALDGSRVSLGARRRSGLGRGGRSAGRARGGRAARARRRRAHLDARAARGGARRERTGRRPRRGGHARRGCRRAAEPRAQGPRAGGAAVAGRERERRGPASRSPRRWRRSHRFDWIVFASRHAVAAVLERCPHRLPVCASPRSARRPRRCCASAAGRVDLVPDEANAAALVGGLQRPAARARRAGAVSGQLARAADHRRGTDAARRAGHAGRGVPHRAPRRSMSPSAAPGSSATRSRAVTFASPSAVIELAQALGRATSTACSNRRQPSPSAPPPRVRSPPAADQAVLAKSATLAGLAHTTLRLLQTRLTTMGFPQHDRAACASPRPGGAWCARRTSPPTPSSTRCSSCPVAACATRWRACRASSSSRSMRPPEHAKAVADRRRRGAAVRSARSEGCQGERCLDPQGLAARAIAAIKEACPKLLVWADVCLCGATDHGHCGHVLRPASSTTTPRSRRWRRWRSTTRAPAPMRSRRAT